MDGESNSTNKRITDLTYLRSFAGGNESVVREMIMVFLEQNPLDLQSLDNAMQTNDFGSVKSLAHDMQTSLGFIGFPGYAMEELRQLEFLAGTTTQKDLLAEKIETITSFCKQAREELKQ